MIDTVSYVINAPFFWTGIGMTSASSVFLGATLYNGDLKKLGKALLVIGFYAFYLFIITASRIYTVGLTTGVVDVTKAHAGLLTWFIVTIAYVLGLIIGVTTIRMLHLKHEN